MKGGLYIGQLQGKRQDIWNQYVKIRKDVKDDRFDETLNPEVSEPGFLS